MPLTLFVYIVIASVFFFFIYLSRWALPEAAGSKHVAVFTLKLEPRPRQHLYIIETTELSLLARYSKAVLMYGCTGRKSFFLSFDRQ